MQPTAPPLRRDLPSLPPRFALCIARCGERIGLPRAARAPDAHAHTSLLPPVVLPIRDEGTEGMRRDSFLLSSADTPWLPHLPFGSPIRVPSLVHTSPSPRRHELHKSPVVASRSISPSVAISIMYPLLTSWPGRRQKTRPTLFQPGELRSLRSTPEPHAFPTVSSRRPHDLQRKAGGRAGARQATLPTFPLPLRNSIPLPLRNLTRTLLLRRISRDRRARHTRWPEDPPARAC